MSADEFQVIRDLFAPAARDPGARGLMDDAALIGAQGPLVVTTDALVEGVHFLPDDPIATVAMKAMRANVSDLVGKGAAPAAALLTLIWPNDRPAEDIAIFAEAIRGELESFGMTLLGGDTTSTEGPLTISITAFGAPLGDRVPARSEALAGDDVWLVGGEIGSAWLGLQVRTGAIKPEEITQGRDEEAARAEAEMLAPNMPDYLLIDGKFDPEMAWLMSCYLAPFVRVECADVVSQVARASMDVSDGLVADAAKMAAASGVAIKIDANAIPFAVPAARWVMSGGDFRKLITGGDDYVVLFTAPPEAREALERAETEARLGLTRIGVVEPGEGVSVVDRNGVAVPLPESGGYTHKLGK
ncbi:MAG: thiamine-phosphate kinase [Hyphomonadaceae bacterium]